MVAVPVAGVVAGDRQAVLDQPQTRIDIADVDVAQEASAAVDVLVGASQSHPLAFNEVGEVGPRLVVAALPDLGSVDAHEPDILTAREFELGQSPGLDPGTYAVDVDSLRPRPVVDLPSGFSFDTSPEVASFDRLAKPDCTLSALACRRTPDEPSGPGGRLKVGFWNGEQILIHPNLCGRFEDFKHPGPSVDNLATTLTELPGFRATVPAPVSLGGYDGLYVELVTVAPSCPAFWLTSRDTGLADDAVRGHVERLWILDVEGGRIVVEASHEPGATEEQVAELTRIVESVRFTGTE